MTTHESQPERVVGLTKDVGWEIGVSRTLLYLLTDVWHLLISRDGLALWLGPGAELSPERGGSYATATGVTGEIRSFHDGSRIRLTWRPSDWKHDTTLQVTVSASGSGTLLRFHQERLASSAEREAQRIHWQSVVDALAAALGASRQ
ncbi:MAG TPA: SRPBCC domain-containing protein [Mycobacteriales bacterium]|nr:SRPBCC domain-containing protein [Mycobacteriales bacterium]